MSIFKSVVHGYNVEFNTSNNQYQAFDEDGNVIKSSRDVTVIEKFLAAGAQKKEKKSPIAPVPVIIKGYGNKIYRAVVTGTHNHHGHLQYWISYMEDKERQRKTVDKDIIFADTEKNAILIKEGDRLQKEIDKLVKAKEGTLDKMTPADLSRFNEKKEG